MIIDNHFKDTEPLSLQTISVRFKLAMAATGTSSPLTSVPQTTPTLLPFFAKTASGHVSIYRLKGILISLLQVVSVSILIVIGFV